jgi:hypothetical protein
MEGFKKVFCSSKFPVTFESHRQTEHEPSKLLASPALRQTSHHSVMLESYAFLPSSGAEEVFAVLDVPVV